MLHCPCMGLAPGVFMWSNVLSFGEVGRARILRCVQIAHCNQDPVGPLRVWVWPEWLFAVDGKAPVKGFTQAREPSFCLSSAFRFWS